MRLVIGRWHHGHPGVTGEEGSGTGVGNSWGSAVILPSVADPHLVTVRRGGTLSDADHHLLALWAAHCAEHVLGLFEAVRPEDRDAEHGRTSPGRGVPEDTDHRFEES